MAEEEDTTTEEEETAVEPVPASIEELNNPVITSMGTQATGLEDLGDAKYDPKEQVVQEEEKLKTDNVALNGGKSAADYKRLSSENKDVLVFERNKKGTKVTFIANLTDKEQKTTVTILGNFTDYMNNTKVEFKEGETITLKPWEYKILIN
mgnify:CR=1 FL=1